MGGGAGGLVIMCSVCSARASPLQLSCDKTETDLLTYKQHILKEDRICNQLTLKKHFFLLILSKICLMPASHKGSYFTVLISLRREWKF